MKHNRMAMKTMQQMLKQGGQIIWVAPSGGRDRTDAEGNYCVSPFDAKSVEMFRLMSDKAGRRTHFYPTSMLTHNIAPPPEQARVLPPGPRAPTWPACSHLAHVRGAGGGGGGCGEGAVRGGRWASSAVP